MSELGRPWDELVTSFHHYSDLWAKNGFMRMFRELASNEGIFQRLLSYENGERRLTNLLHLAEIIEARFGKNRDITAALRWLATMRDNPPIEDKESLVRLESDEDRVKIVTLHASKGLQFPIVFLPFSWGGGLRNFRHEQIIFHDTDRSNQATLDFGSENFQKNRSRACEEELAESLRLLYVGLTRAESRCYIAWGAVNNAETSALAWLLHRPEKISDKGKIEDLIQHFSTLTYDDFMGRLNTLTGLGSPHITVQALPVFEKPLTSDPKPCSKKLVARKVRRRIDQAWSMTSFSSLTKGQGQDTERQEYGSRKNKLLTSNGAISNDIFSFPKGVRAGTCIHKIFEQIDFSSTEAQSRRSIVRRLLDVYGFEERWLDIVDSMLTKVLCTSLDSSSSLFLSNVTKSQRVDEMAFYYPILGLRSEEFYELLSDQKTSFGKVGAKLTHTIDFNALPGFMNGYIDLVFESEGRFWIVDYKSNHLGDSLHDYQAETLELVMAHEQYVLQYLIYTLAVHRFLRKKLDDYEYDRHFGGVYYLFVRGMDPNFKGDGVFFDRPPLQLIEDLDRLVAGGNQK